MVLCRYLIPERSIENWIIITEYKIKVVPKGKIIVHTIKVHHAQLEDSLRAHEGAPCTPRTTMTFRFQTKILSNFQPKNHNGLITGTYM